MSKERLEEIKMKVDNTSEPMMYVPYGDIDWLIEQAERVQELEAENERLRTRRDHLAHRLKIRREENQRYKEAMEFAVRYLSGSDLYDIQSVVNALQEALKGESE